MSSAYNVVKDFEKEVASFCGAKYGVAVESCSAALFLSLKYLEAGGKIIDVPRRTYVSVACQVVHAGARIRFTDNKTWQEVGYYQLSPLPIIDAAKVFAHNMCNWPNLRGKFVCLSFHGKKPLHIDRGGMILTDDKKAVEWFKCARFDGRHEVQQLNDKYAMAGWNMYLTPGQAARGLERLQWMPKYTKVPFELYPDLKKYRFFTMANRPRKPGLNG